MNALKSILSAFLIGVFVLPGVAFAEDPDVDYGEMYVLQKRDRAPQPWQAGFAYTYGFSNPYLGIHGMQLSMARRLSDYFSLGIAPAIFASTKKDVATSLTRELGAQGITTNIYEPDYSAYAVVGFTPLSGMLNWFSSSAVNFDFIFTLGGGLSKYKQDSRMIPSFKLAATPQIMITRAFGVSAGVQSTYEHFSSSDWQNRIDTVLGMVGRF